MTSKAGSSCLDRDALIASGLRQDLAVIRQAALEAVDPYAAVLDHLSRDGSQVAIGGQHWDLDQSSVVLLAVGKAAVPMAAAAAHVLRDRLAEGVVVTKYGHAAQADLPASVGVIEAGHPIPDQAGLQAARTCIERLHSLTSGDRLLVLLSGGASALLPAPVPGLSLDDLQATTDLLLRAGATIVELNAVRKHLSELKGGQLARLAHPAPVASLILSDVVGDTLDVIASGPTAPDPTTFGEALSVLRRYTVLDRVPQGVVVHLQAGLAGEVAETPKPETVLFGNVTNVVVGSNYLAAEAAVTEAERLGYHRLLLTTFVEGEAREVAKVAVALAKGVRAHGNPIPAPACLVWGGETTVTVRGRGRGGRNQELALAAALGLAGMEGVALMALATDGTDGPTDAAGAIVDGTTVNRVRKQGWDPRATLRDNNSYPLLDAAGDLLRLGPTGTNVNDLLVLLIA